MWWMLACDPGLGGMNFPMTLAGDGVVAQVTQERGCQGSTVRVGVWGPGFQTDGRALATVTTEDDGSTWFNFSVQTGLGEAVAAMRIEGDAGVIPLGMRPGEFELNLTRTDMNDQILQQHVDEASKSLENEISFWQQGRFLIQSETETIGEIRFRGDKGPIVSVHDAWWLTPRPVEATQQTMGAEIVLQFGAEPSLQGEDALMRINVPLRSVVVPVGPVPVDEERRFRIEPGELSDQDRQIAIERAVNDAQKMENTFIQSLIPKLAEAALTKEGTCRKLEEMDNEWSMMLQGYDVVLSAVSSGCSVGIEPSQKQHGRSFRGVVNP